MNLPQSPRYILVHSHQATLDANDVDTRAHAFGPFDSYEAMAEFDARTPKDSCYRIGLPLIGPMDQDISLVVAGVNLGFRPSALPLPERSGSGVTAEDMSGPVSRLVMVLKTAFSSMEEDAKARAKAERKAAKKEAKRQARAQQEPTE